MAGWLTVVRCVGEAVYSRWLRIASEFLPLGGAVYDVAENAAKRLQAQNAPPTALVDEPPARPAVADARLGRFLDTGQTGGIAGMLDLSGKPVGDDGLAALASSPRLADLDALLLSGCGIGDEGAAALAASVFLENLRRLVLWDNRIGDVGVGALAGAYLPGLETLDLGRNRVGDAGVAALARAPHLGALRALILVSNRIGDEGALALASSGILASLAELKPLDNRITAAGAAALKGAFGKRVRVM